MRSFGSETRMPTLAAVLDLIRERTAVSRVELAEATGLTQATMTHAVRKLMAMGFVVEAGTAPSSRGTPRRLLALRPEASYQVGIQFDKFATVGVVVDLAGRVVVRREMPGAGDNGPAKVLAEFAAAVESMLEEAAVPREKVIGIGLATHGPQDRDAGVLLTPHPGPEWEAYPLTATLAEATGLPVSLENDATAAGIGVQALSRSQASFAVVYMSGGIGSGLIIDGYPYRGATSNGLELGHISIDARGPQCHCGNRGCLDSSAGPWIVASRAREDPGLATRIELGRDTLADFRAIARAALDDDPAATALIEDSAQLLAVATVTLVNLFDISRIVLAGAAFTEIGPRYRDAMQRALDESVFMRDVHTVTAELADDVSQAAAVGAAIVVLRNLLESPNGTDR